LQALNKEAFAKLEKTNFAKASKVKFYLSREKITRNFLSCLKSQVFFS